MDDSPAENPQVSDAARQASPVHSTMGALDRAILRGWKFFKSLKMGILLLAAIGGVCIYGTMGFASNAALGDNQIPMARRIVFQSPYFAALLAIFAYQLILSTWHVTLMSLSIGKRREFRRDPGYFGESGGGAPRAVVKFDELPTALAAFLNKRFSRVHSDGDAWFAHRGLRTRVGPTIVHVGMLMVLGAGVARFALVKNGTIMSEGRFVAAEGEFSNAIWEPIDDSQTMGGRNVKAREIPGQLYIRVLDFDEDQHANIGSPKYFSSLVEVTDPKTSQIYVRQLDMNHSTNVGGYQFHQAGYEEVPEQTPTRFNFDVRSASTGERIAVTDASKATPVRIGATDWHLIVDGTRAGSRWQIFHRENPTEPLAEGIVGGKGEPASLQFAVVQFFPDFQIDRETKQPKNGSDEPRNPAAQVVTYLDGQPKDAEWLFLDRELAAAMPDRNPFFRLALNDVQVRSTSEKVQWNEPGSVRFIVDAAPRDGGTTESMALILGQKSEPREFAGAPAKPERTGREKDFEVLSLGPTKRYMTVLSVTNEPTSGLTTIGVAVILFGAMMTFSGRYEALYGLWNAERRELRLALVPRWGYGMQAARDSLEGIVRDMQELGGTGRVMEPATTAPDTGLAAPQAVTEA